MAKGVIGAKLVLEGESQYKQSLKNIATAQKELKSEMTLCSAEFKNNQNSIEALTKKHNILQKQYDEQAKKVKVYADAVEEAEKAQKETQASIDKYTKELEDEKKALDDLEKSGKASNEELEEQKKKVKAASDALERSNKHYDQAIKKTTEYKTSLNYAEASLSTLDSELKQNDKYIDEAKNSTDKCAKSIDNFGKEVKDTEGQVSVFGDVLKANLASEVIIEGAKKLATAIKDIALSAVDAGGAFEKSMSQVAATMDISSEAIANGAEEYTMLSDKAKEMGASTMFSASQAADALNYLALAGYDANKAVDALPKILTLAAAGGMDLAYASDLVTDSMSALGLQTSDIDLFMDELAKTSQKANANVSQLGEAVLICAGTVSGAKMPLEDMNTALGVMANNGLKGAEGGTHLRNIILSLTAPTDTAAKALERLGLNVEDNEGNMRSLSDIVTDLNKSLDGMGNVAKSATLKEIFNKTDITAVNALMKSMNGEWQTLNENIQNASGSAEEMADVMQNNLQGDITTLNSALEGLAISAFECFDDSLREGVQGATDAVTLLNKSITSGNMNVSLQKLGQSFEDLAKSGSKFAVDVLPACVDGLSFVLDNAGAIASGITGIVVATKGMEIASVVTAAAESFAAFKTAEEGATVAQWALNVAMEANPIGLVVTALAGLTAGLVAYGAITAATAEDSSEKIARQSENLVSDYKKATEATEELTESSKEFRTETRATGQCVDDLSKRLEALAKKKLNGSLTSEELIELKSGVEYLNSTYSGLGLTVDTLTDSAKKNSNAWRDNLNAMQKQATAQAVSEKMTDLSKQRADNEDEIYEIQRKQNELIEKYGDDLKTYYDYYKNDSPVDIDSNDSLLIDSEEIQQAVSDYDALIQSENDLTDANKKLSAEQNILNGMIEAESEVTSKSVEVNDEAIESYHELSEAASEYAAKIAENIASQISLFDKLEIAQKQSFDTTKNNLEYNNEAMSEWLDNMDTLVSRGLSREVMSELWQMGINSAGYVKGLLDASKEELDELEEQVNRRNELIVKSNIDSANYYDGVTNNSQIWNDTANAWVDASTESVEEAGKAQAEKAVESTAKTIVDDWGRVVEAQDFAIEEQKEKAVTLSEESGREVGEKTTDSTAEGMLETKDRPADAAEVVAKSVKTELETVLSASNMNQMGKTAMIALANGILAGKTSVQNAMKSVLESMSLSSDSASAQSVNSDSKSVSTYSTNTDAKRTFNSNTIENNVTVTLSADSEGIFNIVQQQAKINKKATGRSGL